ncbi:flavoprotein, partial [Ideonella azotifigens]
MAERQDLAGKHIVLGLSGGVACYKAAELTRSLVKAGATVQVVMTEAAEAFITAVTMQALSNRPVYTSQWDARPGNNMAHINLTRERPQGRAAPSPPPEGDQEPWGGPAVPEGADAVLIAPASADFIAKLVQG